MSFRTTPKCEKCNKPSTATLKHFYQIGRYYCHDCMENADKRVVGHCMFCEREILAFEKISRYGDGRIHCWDCEKEVEKVGRESAERLGIADWLNNNHFDCSDEI